MSTRRGSRILPSANIGAWNCVRSSSISSTTPISACPRTVPEFRRSARLTPPMQGGVLSLRRGFRSERQAPRGQCGEHTARLPTTLSLSVKLVERHQMAVLDWSLCPAVESVPGKLSGAWVLKGTRMPVSVIFENLEAGASLDDIMEWFDGLDREQVKAVL